MEVRPAVALVALLLVAQGAFAWDQAKGGPDRNGRLALPPGPTDVLLAGRIDDALYSYWGAMALWTAHGLATVGIGDGCRILLVADLADPAPRTIPIEDCGFSHVVGYDEARDRLILCQTALGGFPVLQAWDLATGTMAWGVAPTRTFAGSFQPGAFWFCRAPAIQGDEIVAAFGTFQSSGPLDYDAPHQIVAAHSLADGALRWQSSIPVDAFLPPLVPDGSAEPNPQRWIPQGVSVSTAGVFVTGFTHACSASGVGCEDAFVAWFTTDGLYRGAERAQTAKPPGVPSRNRPFDAFTRAVSQYVVTEGAVGFAVVGSELIVVNPELNAPTGRGPATGVEAPSGGLFFTSGHAADGLVTAGFRASVNAYAISTLDRAWSFTEGLDWSLVDLVAARGDVLLALFARVDARAELGEPRLVLLDARTGALLDRIDLPPMPDSPSTQGVDFYGRIVPTPDGRLVVLSDSGDYVVLGVAPAGSLPEARLSNAFPAPGEAIRIETSGGRMRVDWGDGTIDEGTGPFAHAFPTVGRRDVRVKELREDGTTSTRVLVVDVGGVPPPQLTRLQKAFSPEWQEVTFFVLGAFVTIVGLAWSAARHRRRFARLDRELAALERIRSASVADPHGAVLALKTYRSELPRMLARRRIDDSQYQVLDARSARLLRVLRARLFAAFDARLSPRFHRQLDAAFDDAILHVSERDALVAALAEEGALDAAGRSEVQALLDVFTTPPG